MKKSKIKQTKSKAVLVIDNEPIRQKSIQQVVDLIAQLEDIEKKALRFKEIDLKLYTDWYNLTFNPVLASIEELRSQYLQLADFHNSMIKVSEDQDIGMPFAYLFLKEEEERFKNGDEKIRKEIENLREKRKKEIFEELYGSSTDEEDRCNCEICRARRTRNEEENFYDDENEDSDDQKGRTGQFGEKDDFKSFVNEIEQENKEIEEKRKRYAAKIKYYENISDKNLAKILKRPDEGFLFVVEALSILLSCSRIDLFRRIWKQAPMAVKKVLNQKAKIDFGNSIEDFIEEFELETQIKQNFYKQGNRDGFDDDRNDFEDDDYFSYDFFDDLRDRKNPHPKELNEDDKLKLKYFYRKIVRKIHPDNFNLDVSPEIKVWFGKIWEKVAVAYQSDHLEKMTSLYHKVMIGLKEYNELGIADLADAAKSLQSEYWDLDAEYSDLQNNPAWNFSDLKDYKKLKAQLIKPFNRQKRSLQKDLNSLKQKHAELAELAASLQSSQFKASSRKRPQRRKSQSHQRKKKSSAKAQMNFNFN